MTAPRSRITLVPLGDAAPIRDRCTLAGVDEPDLTLGRLLAESPAFATEPLAAELMDVPVVRIRIDFATPTPEQPLYWPPGVHVAGVATQSSIEAVTEPDTATVQAGGSRPGSEHPRHIDEATAVKLAHDFEIGKAADYVDNGLSVLIRCEKLLVEHLAAEIGRRSNRRVVVVEAPTTPTGRDAAMTGGRRQQQLAAMQTAVREAKPRDLIVVPHLDLLAGGSDAALSAEARELTDVLYDRSESVLLGFVDPSLVIPEVLANRFAVRLAIDILPRDLISRDGHRVPIGRALVTAEEAELFSGFDSTTFYKHIAGMNAVRMRHTIRFAYQQHLHKASTFDELVAEVRAFKAATSTSFELPNVSFDDIGGYHEVRAELLRALRLIAKADELPPKLRHELVPRGFIFHGPPGTGKTLFAKAVATKLDATILVVSGPEVTDMYVGESERKVREIFAEARRNAPAVIVFDEFDSIASKRSGREDGGSRAGNAIVAQLLTELDGFRPEVPVLVIGTTNRLDIIDDALLRPSRFRPIHIDLPDALARKEIARVHARHFGVPVSDELLTHLAQATNRMNGDEIRSIFRDARADELLGRPQRPASPRRLGELVGELRRVAQDRDLSRGIQTSRAPARQSGRSPMVPATSPMMPPSTGPAANTRPSAAASEETPAR